MCRQVDQVLSSMVPTMAIAIDVTTEMVTNMTTQRRAVIPNME